MKVEPAGLELLRVARKTFLEELLPQLPEPARYHARMVANAIAIALRELEPEVSLPTPQTRREDEELARAIRGGGYDSPAQMAPLMARLREATRARLAVSNPRILSSKAK